MLRLAVVHQQPGPQRGPGLYESDRPGGEAQHSYVGNGVWDWEKPYEKGDIDYRQQRDKPRKKKRDKASRGNIKVAIDFDGTITSNPRAFKRLVDKITKGGGKAYLVTGRPHAESEEVLSYCKRYGLKFKSHHFYPLHYEFDWIKWDDSIDAKIGAWKAKEMRSIGIDIAIDDNPIHTMQIKRHVPNILVLTPIGG
jgi:hypothetical protein